MQDKTMLLHSVFPSVFTNLQTLQTAKSTQLAKFRVDFQNLMCPSLISRNEYM